MEVCKKQVSIHPLKGFFINNYMRPICISCNKNPRAINYHHQNGNTYYRTVCEECRRRKEKKPPYKPQWLKGGYKKKPTCDCCGFKSVYPSQMTVYHIDGNLNNTLYNNLRTICLNCVEIIKRREVNWKRGDLTVDY